MIDAAERRAVRTRLHALSPLVRGGRTAVGLVVVLALAQLRAGPDTHLQLITDAAAVGVAFVLGFVHWYVTWYSFDGTTLTVETGLLRRDVRSIPVARVQAIDVVQPAIGKMLSLSELRIRMAGAGKDERLAYLDHATAHALRATLLARHHGVDAATPAPAAPSYPVTPPGRLAAGIALSGPSAFLVLVVAAVASLWVADPPAGAQVARVGAAYLFGMVAATWRRFNGEYGCEVSLAADGLRVRRGLVGTVSETIPRRRIQAVRRVDPLAWRPWRWARLQVDLAGVVHRDEASGPRGLTRVLVPVGTDDVVSALQRELVDPRRVELARPPRRARWKAPLSYRHLAAGYDERVAIATTGRLSKVTSWVPLEKVQSVRRVQGPVQRALGLASLHLDVAGRRAHAVFKDRDAAEVDGALDELVAHCRAARQTAPLVAPPRPVGSAARGQTWSGPASIR